VHMGGGAGPRDDRLGVALEHRGDTARVVLAGELDLASVPRFESLLAAAFEIADHCVIDLRELAFVDSSGLRALLRARRRASESGATLEIVHPTPTVARVLADAGVEHVLGD
jgi:anti-sigma B factor antagonist